MMTSSYAELEHEVKALRLVNEQLLAGNVDPVSIINAISSECLRNRNTIQRMQHDIDQLRAKLGTPRDN